VILRDQVLGVRKVDGRLRIASPFSIITPAPTLGFCNPGAASLGLRTRRQSAVQAAARFPELNPHPTRPARSGFGTTDRSIFAPWSLPEV
jgi:hypothetical protein